MPEGCKHLNVNLLLTMGTACSSEQYDVLDPVTRKIIFNSVHSQHQHHHSIATQKNSICELFIWEGKWEEERVGGWEGGWVGGRKNCGAMGESLHCALLLDYVPPEEPLGTPLGNTLRSRRPKLDWRGP